MPKKSIFDRYETYDPEKEGYGNPEQWKAAFQSAVGKISSTSDPFQILGISRNSSLQEIQSKYRQLALQNHPDKFPERENTFKDISLAYRSALTIKQSIQSAKASKQTTDILPQLLNEIEKKELEFYFTNPDYCAQEKHDGRRRLLHFYNNQTQAINKKGQITGCLPNFEIDCKLIANSYNLYEFILDGEEVNGIFYNFDILSQDNSNLRNLPYLKRIKLLKSLNSIQQVYTAYSEIEKRTLFHNLLQENKEGIIFKLLSGKHQVGYSNDQVKFKFYSTASVIVIKINEQNSVGIAVMDGNQLIPIGNVTCIGHKKPELGEIIEVKYLYANPGGCLYQPAFLNKRDDMDKIDCQISKIKFKR